MVGIGGGEGGGACWLPLPPGGGQGTPLPPKRWPPLWPRKRAGWCSSQSPLLSISPGKGEGQMSESTANLLEVFQGIENNVILVYSCI